MPEDQPKLPAAFYRTANGVEPVREWLRGLSGEDRKIIGRDIARVQYGWPVGMPTCRPLGDGLYEVRSNLPRRIARVLFCLEDGNFILLHGFFKDNSKDTAVRSGDSAVTTERRAGMTNSYIGSSFDDFLKEEGIYEEVRAAAVKEVLAWQIDECRQAQGLSKSALAKRMETSRSQLDRLLDPSNTQVQLDTIQRAAAALGRTLVIELA